MRATSRRSSPIGELRDLRRARKLTAFKLRTPRTTTHTFVERKVSFVSVLVLFTIPNSSTRVTKLLFQLTPLKLSPQRLALSKLL